MLSLINKYKSTMDGMLPLAGLLFGLLLTVLICMYGLMPLLATVVFVCLIFLVILKKPVYLALSIIILNEISFNLVNLPKSVTYMMELGQLFLILIMFLMTLKDERYRHIKFKGTVAFFIIINIAAVLKANYMINQPLGLGAAAIRYNLLILFYIPLAIILCDKENRKFIDNCMYSLSIIIPSLNILQYIFVKYKGISLMDIDMTSRLGEDRFLISGSFLYISFFFCLSNMLRNEKRYQKKYIFAVVLQLITFVFIGKTRMAIFGILIATMVILLVQKEFKALIIMSSILTVFLLVNSTIFDLIKVTGEEILSSEGNYHIRVMEINYYTRYIKENPLAGVGKLSFTYGPAILLSGKHLNYYASDVGFIGFVFYYGALGVIWLTAFLAEIFMRLRQIDKGKMAYVFALSYLIFNIAVSPTILLIQSASSMIYIAVFLAYISSQIYMGDRKVEYKKIGTSDL